MAHTEKHARQQKEERFKKFLEQKGKRKEKDTESGKRKPKKEPEVEIKPQTVPEGKKPKNEGPKEKKPMKKQPKTRKALPDSPTKYDKVVLGGNKGDKSKTKPGKKDYEGASKMKKDGASKMKKDGASKMKDGAMKMPDGYNMKRPAEKLGFIQKFGADRMSPGKMGDEIAAKMMHGDAAAKYYDGGAKYMNGMPKYEGASKAYGPMKHVKGHIEGLPSYTTTNTSTTRSGGGSSSTSSSSSSSSSKGKLEKASGGGSGTSGKSKSEYMSGLIGSKKFSGRSGSEMAEAGYISKSNIDAYDKLRGGSSSSKSSSSSNKSSVKTDVKKKTNVVGTQTQKDVLNKAEETIRNKFSKKKAYQDKEMIKAQADSAKVAQAKIKEYNKRFPLDQRGLDIAHRAGNRAGKASLQKARGPEGQVLFSGKDAREAFNTTSAYPVFEGTGVGVKPDKKISKRNPEQKKQVGVQEPGYLGQRPMIEDYEGANKMGHNAPKMPTGPMKFGMKK